MEQSNVKRAEAGVKQQAVSWYLRIEEGISQSDFRSWRAWLAEDEANAEAFDAVSEFWQQSEQLDDLPWPTDQELVADNYDGSLALPLAEKTVLKLPAPKRGRRAWLALAASVAIASVLSVALLKNPEPIETNFQTAIGEHQVIDLEDGSRITLGAHSVVSVSFDKDLRQIKLESGEAYFKVAKDSSRPFIVAAGSRTVHAVGTEFNVNIGVRDIKVSVLEGRVKVEGPSVERSGNPTGQESATVSSLETGDVLDFNAVEDIGIVREVDPLFATSWLDRRLAYVGAPMESVIADVNRYSEIELIIGDQATQQLTFTGTIFSDDIGDWLSGLEKAFPLRLVKVEGHGILLIQTDV